MIDTLRVFLKEFFEKVNFEKCQQMTKIMKNYPACKDFKILFLASHYNCLNPLYSGNPLTSTFANSEDPDKMQHYAAFHQGLHFLYVKIKKSSNKKIQYFFENYNPTLLDMYNRLSQAYCFKPKGKIH